MKKGPTTLFSALIFFIILFVYYKYNKGPLSGSNACSMERRFHNMEFKAVVLDTFFMSKRGNLHLRLDNNEETELNLFSDENSIYKNISPQDSIIKIFRKPGLTIKNKSKFLVLTPQFNCR